MFCIGLGRSNSGKVQLAQIVCTIFLASLVHGQFFHYFHTLPTQQSYSPILQPPLIPQPQFYYQQQAPQPVPQLETPASAFRHPEIPSFKDNNYLGFSYHTAHDDGASSSVVFFNGRVTNDVTYLKNRITVASDSLDPQRTHDVEENIRSALNGRTAKTSLKSSENILNFSPIVAAILDNPHPQFGTFYYYETDGLPASTSLLKYKEEENSTVKSEESETAESKLSESLISKNGEENNVTPSVPSTTTEAEDKSSVVVEARSGKSLTDDLNDDSTVTNSENTTSSSTLAPTVTVNADISTTKVENEPDKENASIPTTTEPEPATSSATNEAISS